MTDSPDGSPQITLDVLSQILCRCIESGDVEAVRGMLRATQTLASRRFSDGSTPLHIAAQCNSTEIVAQLVGAGAPLDVTYGSSGHTALSWAITVGSMNAALKLVELGQKPDLFCAAGLGLLDNVQAFWDGGTLRPHPSTTGSSRYSDSGSRLPCPPERAEDQVSDALYIACRSSRLDVARWLLDHGADPNWCGYLGATCLAWAEFSGNNALCELLRKRGASDDVIDSEFKATPKVFGLMVMAAWGFWSERLRSRLSAAPGPVHSRGGWGTLLNAAAYNGQVESAKILLEFGADRSARNAAGLTPAEVASTRGHTELTEILR